MFCSVGHLGFHDLEKQLGLHFQLNPLRGSLVIPGEKHRGWTDGQTDRGTDRTET